MADHFLSRSGGGRTAVLSNEDGVFQLRGKACTQLVEIPDIHFHLDSPMVFLDPDGALVQGLSQAFFVAEDHPDWKVVVAGHADTSGDIRPNYALSLQRARCIQAVLVGDQAQWNEVAAQAKVEDLQRTLKSLADLYYWHCDPGEVDGRMGPATRNGVEGFQHEANSHSPEGDPMPGVLLRLVDGDGNPVGEVGTTNAKGWAHWMGLEPGEYEVQLA